MNIICFQRNGDDFIVSSFHHSTNEGKMIFNNQISFNVVLPVRDTVRTVSSFKNTID
jgi:hypothetical protein